MLTSQEEANKYNTYSYIFGTTNGAITYSSIWTPVIIEETEKVVYTVTFNTMGGSSIDSQNVTEGNKLTAPSAPSKDGYVFDGWYTNSSCTTAYNFNSTVTNSFTLYAKWTAASTSLTLNAVLGYTEGLYATFDETNASSASAAYSTDGTTWTPVDNELIRQTSDTEARVEVVGLKVGSYSLKVTSSSGKTCIVNNIYVAEDDRSGYAHFGNTTGIGAYNNDGTLKSNAVVVYVTDATKNNTFTIAGKSYAGLGGILASASNISVPLDIRFLDVIKTTQWNIITYKSTAKSSALIAEQMATVGNTTDAKTYEADIISNGWNSHSNDEAKGITKLNGLTSYFTYGTQSASATGYEYDSCWNMMNVSGGNNITVEGIGTSAGVFQWGFTWKNCKSIEVKNLTFDDYTEDACSFEASKVTASDSDTSKDLSIFSYGYSWVHNCTFEEGVNNWDLSCEKDKGDGDGSTDIKYVRNITISYTKYVNTHKTGLVGGGDNHLSANITFHHNYYNNCRSRMPFARQANMHMYNNYYSASTGTTMQIYAGAYAFIENCYFENDNCTFDINSKGYATPAVKSYNNIFNGSKKYEVSGVTFATTRDQIVSNGNLFNSTFDTDSTNFYYDSANKVSDVMLLESASDAKNTVLEYAGVLKTTTSGGSIESGILYTVTFDTNGGTTVSDMTVKEGKTITLPTSTKSGYKLEGWYSDSSLTEAFTSQTAVTGNITLYAKWVEATTYTVTFNTNGGSSVPSINVVEGNTITLPTAPTKDGYTFVGWYTDSSLATAFSESTIISSNMTLYAKWVDSSLSTYTVLFNNSLTQVDSNNATLTSSSDVYVSSATTAYKDYNGTINGDTIARGLKVNSGASVTFTIKQKMTLTVYIALNNTQGHGLLFTDDNGNTYSIDHSTNTAGTGYITAEITLEAGTYKMTRCCNSSKEFSLGAIIFNYA